MKKKKGAGSATADFGEIAQRGQRFLHGGRVALSLAVSEPCGQSVAAVHTRAAVQKLCDFAERVLLPRAVQELEACIREGRGYAFVPHRYRIRVEAAPQGARWCVTVQTVYRAGKHARRERTLCMYWSADLRVQHRMCFL